MERNKGLGQFANQPGFSDFIKDYLRFRAEHPEMEKPTDLPIAKVFPALDWNSGSEIQPMLQEILKHRQQLQDESRRTRNSPDFVNRLIVELSNFRALAFALEISLEEAKGFPPRT